MNTLRCIEYENMRTAESATQFPPLPKGAGSGERKMSVTTSGVFN